MRLFLSKVLVFSGFKASILDLSLPHQENAVAGEAFTPTIKGLECIRDSLSPSDGLLSAERMSMACIRAAPYVKAFLCAIALKSRRHVVVVDPHSAEAFPARGLRPSTPNVVFVPFYIRHSHNKAVDVHDYAFPDGRWVGPTHRTLSHKAFIVSE